MREVAAWADFDHIPASEVHHSVPLAPRFALDQRRCLGAKIRMVDNFRASGVISTLSVAGAIIPDVVGSFLALRIAYQRALRGRRLLACSVHFDRAYKHIPLLAAQAEFASIALPNTEGEPLVGGIRTQHFGSSRAPANWVRFTGFAKFARRRLLRSIYCCSPTIVLRGRRMPQLRHR